jgi:nucleotide-binding universal stress UspA family protein
MFTRILFYTDGSSASFQAADKVAQLVVPTQNAQVMLVAFLPTGGNPDAVSEALESTEAVFRNYGVGPLKTVIEAESAFEAILAETKRDAYEVVALPGPDETVLANSLHATDTKITTMDFLRQIGIPVLIVPLV